MIGREKVGWSKAERIYMTDEEKDAAVWAQEHRYKIMRVIERAEGLVLRRVAEVLGYEPGEGDGPALTPGEPGR